MAGWKNDRKNKKTWKQHSLFAVALFQRFFHICKCSKTKLHFRLKKVNEIVIWLKHSSHHCRREGGGSEKKRKADNFRRGGLKQGSNGQGWELIHGKNLDCFRCWEWLSGRVSFDKFPEWTIEWIRRHGSNILCSRWLCFNDFFHICKCSKTKLQSRSHCAEKKVNEIVIWLKHSSHHCRREGGGSEKKRKADNFRHGGLKQGSNGQGWELIQKTGIAFVVGSGRFSFVESEVTKWHKAILRWEKVKITKIVMVYDCSINDTIAATDRRRRRNINPSDHPFPAFKTDIAEAEHCWTEQQPTYNFSKKSGLHRVAWPEVVGVRCAFLPVSWLAPTLQNPQHWFLNGF